MLLLLLLLFQELLCHRASTVAPQVLRPHYPVAEEPSSFRVLQVSSFANHSWAHTQASGWLDELQTHRWDKDLGTIRFLRPWSQGNFSKEELKNYQALLQLYYHGFPREVQAFASQFQFECGYSILPILICLTVIVTLVMLVVVDSWFKKQRSNWNIGPPPIFLIEANTQDPRSSGNQLWLAQKSWIKNRFLKKWKTSLNQL
ncbi:PREDICTED: T-cell surface glycoprotein CD1e, membrane-associated-like [Hipposideros armiger]|uniref:T-cell surface glycoprotein CD1e, membrane-associated-like n=1 Tax=Hipposideros armiger TaxID=186990 RepID=A0A8B7QMI4_HIPAR|nr:PREDICTED: T-cell surface glycoprotein CD1e, membrane-associated-like [Hipposideros armiger]